MLSADGTEQYVLSGSWTNPLKSVNPNFGGTRVVLRDPSGNDEIIGTYPPEISAFVSGWRPIPNPPITYMLYYVSLDVNGNANSIVPGITPGFGGLTPVAQTTGSLNGGRFSLASLNGLTVSGGKLQPNATGGLGIVAGAIQMAGSVNVGATQAMTGVYIKPTTSIEGFIGFDATSGYGGGWFGQIKVGGSGPGNAPLYTDSIGNVFLDATLGGGSVSIIGGTFSLNSNGITTTLDNNLGAGGSYYGLSVKDNASSLEFRVYPNQLTWTNGSGVTIGMLGQNANSGFLEIINSLGSTALSVDSSQVDALLYIPGAGGMTIGGFLTLQSTSTSATAGTATLPSAPAGFFKMKTSSGEVRVPYYHV